MDARPGHAAPLARRPLAGVLAGVALGGLCFAPVFGAAPLVLPVVAVCLTCFVAVEVCRRLPRLFAWRPLLTAAAGVLAIVESVLFSTTVAGFPTVETFRALGSGLESWRRALESTWPARPEPELLLFVPLLVLVACVLGVETLDRAGGLPALLPGLGVAGVGQLYGAVSSDRALLIAVGFALAAALVLVPGGSAGRQRPLLPRRPLLPGRAALLPEQGGLLPGRGPHVLGRGPRSPRRRDGTRPLAGVALVLAGVVGGALLVAVDPAGREPYTLQRVQAERMPAHRTTNPLDEVAGRLADPETVAFRFRADEPVERWRLVALDEFDGTTWTTDATFLRLGAELTPRDRVRVPTRDLAAEVELVDLPGPWLPSQVLPRTVEGAGTLFVEPSGGTLIGERRPKRYELTWAEPVVSAADLLAAGVDPRAEVGDLGAVPPRIARLAEDAVAESGATSRAALASSRATFRTALALERRLAAGYDVVTDGRPPSGHGWPQLERFLLDDRRGTSEQFAAAYVVLARLNGIPARLAVGFRSPETADLDGWATVRNGDVLVWPEVALDGIGWWPLDPAGLADPSRAEGRARAGRVTQQARAELPPIDARSPADRGASGDRRASQDVGSASESPSSDDSRRRAGEAAGDRGGLWWLLVLLPLGWGVGIPSARALRARHRRRRPGAASVIGAWAEVRDLLRSHGVPVGASMTVRDLAAAAGPLADEQVRTGLEEVAYAVDLALWSGAADGRAVAVGRSPNLARVVVGPDAARPGSPPNVPSSIPFDVENGLPQRDASGDAGRELAPRSGLGQGMAGSTVLGDEAAASVAMISQQAWDGVQKVRSGLRRRPWGERLRAAIGVRGLLP